MDRNFSLNYTHKPRAAALVLLSFFLFIFIVFSRLSFSHFSTQGTSSYLGGSSSVLEEEHRSMRVSAKAAFIRIGRPGACVEI